MSTGGSAAGSVQARNRSGPTHVLTEEDLNGNSPNPFLFTPTPGWRNHQLNFVSPFTPENSSYQPLDTGLVSIGGNVHPMSCPQFDGGESLDVERQL